MRNRNDCMTILLRFLVGIISAILGAVVVFVLDLATGEEIQFIPVSEFIIPILIGATLGFCLGFTFYKAIGRLFSFLGRFGIETSS